MMRVEVKRTAATCPQCYAQHCRRGRGATCSAGVALATQVESLRNPAKPRTPFLPSVAILRRRMGLPVAASFAKVALATEAESRRAFWRRRVKPELLRWACERAGFALDEMHRVI